MGKDVEKIKKFLSQGYQISEQSYSFNKVEGTKNQFTHIFTISLAKGNSKEKIISQDDDIFDFMLHFVKIKDQFDNYHFVYMDDYQKYKDIDHTKLPPSFVDKHEIWIGPRKFEKGVFIMALTQPQTSPEKQLCEFFINFKKNPSLKDVDFKDGVKIVEKETKKSVFFGYIDHSSHSHDSQFFVCEGGTKFLAHTKISIAANIPVWEMMNFVTKSAGLQPKFPEPVQSVFTNRDFVVIMPIENLTLQENISIADTTIYYKLDSTEDHLIRKQETAYKDSDWNGNNLRIRTKVSANSFFEAVMKGQHKISAIIDCIAFRSDFSYPYYKINNISNNVLFSCYRYFSRIKTYPKIFCKQIGNNSHLLCNLKTITANKLVFDYGSKEFFNPVNELFENILSKDTTLLDETERSILSSSHWLRLGIFSDDLIERLIYLYNSLEFAVSGISTPKIFSSSEIESIKQKIQEISFSEERYTKIKNKINDLNNLSLFEKLEWYSQENNISIHDAEWTLIQLTRRKRNGVIHGKKDIIVNKIELEKLQTLIEKILLCRLEIMRNRS